MQALRIGCACASVKCLFHRECAIYGFKNIPYPRPGILIREE